MAKVSHVNRLIEEEVIDSETYDNAIRLSSRDEVNAILTLAGTSFNKTTLLEDFIESRSTELAERKALDSEYEDDPILDRGYLNYLSETRCRPDCYEDFENNDEVDTYDFSDSLEGFSVV